jgi:hypothetical protein
MTDLFSYAVDGRITARAPVGTASRFVSLRRTTPDPGVVLG